MNMLLSMAQTPTNILFIKLLLELRIKYMCYINCTIRSILYGKILKI